MAAKFKDYYLTLGVESKASADEIKKAFRKLARKYHPDVAKDKPDAEDKFKEINEAYEVLGDPEKRTKYDRMGANWKQAGAAPNGAAGGQQPEYHFSGTGFSDFFEQAFGRGQASPFGGGFDAGRNRTGPAKGRDIEGDVMVTLREAGAGSVRAVNLQTVDPVTGQTYEETVRFRIPEGVLDGKLIRVPGKGGPGFNGGAAGDLFLRIRLAKHPLFRVRGADFYHDLALAPWEAVLGAEVPVPTLDQPVTLRIPPGSVSGNQLRVRGRGLRNGKDKQGDLYVVLDVRTPEKSTEAEQEIWKQLAATSTFTPRTP